MGQQGHTTYQTIRKLGHGAFGEVMLARAVETGEVVALKRIYIKHAGEGIPENVLREIKCMQAVDHPNVVQLRDVFPKGRSMVLVQEYCAMDLAALLRGQACLLPESLAKGLMQQVLRGLAACHAAGVLHRDLKPSNLLLSSAGWLKIADFGLSRPHNGGERPLYTHTVATRWYRAPELLYGAREYGTGVDLWAAGAIFAEILGLSPLIPGDNDIDQLGRTIALRGSMEDAWPACTRLPDYGKVSFPPAEPQPLERVLPHASPAALALLDKLLRYDPSQRPSAAEALRDPYFTCEPLPAGPADVRELMRATHMRTAELDARMAAAAAAVAASMG